MISLKADNNNIVIKIINNEISKVNKFYVINDNIWYAEVIDKSENIKSKSKTGDILIVEKNPSHYIFSYKNERYAVIDNLEVKAILSKDDFEEFVKNVC